MTILDAIDSGAYDVQVAAVFVVLLLVLLVPRLEGGVK